MWNSLSIVLIVKNKYWDFKALTTPNAVAKITYNQDTSRIVIEEALKLSSEG